MNVVTVITGARKGIGRFLAEHYAERGHKVIGMSRSRSEFESERYEHRQVDVSDERSVIEAFAAIRRTAGLIDHLINCAGIASMNHVLLTPGSVLQNVFATNVFGTFYCSREAAKIMQRRRTGRIVNFSSVAVPMKLEGEAAYAASKAAVVTLSAVMARELGPFGITVNVVGPGATDTDLIRGVPPGRIDALLARQALHRRTTVEDIAGVVDFLLSEAAAHVTGEAIYLGGP